MLHTAKKNIFLRYMSTYLVIVVLSCTIIGLVLFFEADARLRVSYEQALYEKMQNAADDVARQFDVLEQIALNILVGNRFQAHYTARSAFYEIERLEEFSSYTSYCEYSAEYFMLYEGDDAVYLSSGYRSPINIFFNNLLEMDQENITRLTSCNEETFFAYGDRLFFVYPLEIANTGMARLCFVVSRSVVQARCELVSGGLIAPYALYYCGFPLFQGNVGDQWIEKTDATGMATIRVGSDAERLYPQLHAFYNISVILFIAVTLGLLFLAGMIAYRSYRPIGRMLERYLDADIRDASEIRDVSGAMEDISRHMELYAAELRRQTLGLLIHGHYNEDVLARLALLNLPLGSKKCAVVCASFDQPVSCEERKRLYGGIETLGDDVTSFFPVRFEDNHCRLMILICTDENELSDETVDVLGALLQEINPHVEIACGSLGPLTQLNDSYQEATRARVRVEQIKERYFNALLNGDEASAQSVLAQLSALKANSSELVLELLRLCRQRGVKIDAQMQDKLLNIQNILECQQVTGALTKLLCAEPSADGQAYILPITEYIKAHCLEYEFSQKLVADHFGLTPSRLSILFTQATGQSFTDYTVALRMEAAKTLLAQTDLSVTEICEKVGYSNLSHFIRAFRKKCGVTPTVYRSQSR